MFPLVILVVNVSSVAVIWFGGHRIDSGQMEVGALTAFLSYLMQILMSVMMATFMLMMIPRASVCADRVAEVLDTDTSVPMPDDAVAPDPARRGHLDLEHVTFAYPGAEEPVLADVSVSARPWADARGHRLHRRRQDHARQPGAAALRRHRGRGPRRGRRRTRGEPGPACCYRSIQEKEGS